jgi:formylglycine-generating enzyme required for sulfatase activity
MSNNSGENAYTIIETLHKSRQFCVYKAKNYFRGNIVTIKTNEQRWRSDAVLLKNLRTEAATGLQLEHPNIRKTIGIFEDEGTVYMVCEFVPGDSLGAILSAPHIPISLDQAMKWIVQLIEALVFAHANKIVHCNINPSQIIITPDFDLKLIGFGKKPDTWKTAEPDKGEPHPVIFTAPEVFLDGVPDARADLYSVGVLGYLLLCGQLPWTLDKHEVPSQQKQHTFQRPVQNPELLSRTFPHWLFTILNKALMIDPEKRFSSAEEMLTAINDQREFTYESCLTPAKKEQPPQRDPTLQATIEVIEEPKAVPEDEIILPWERAPEKEIISEPEHSIAEPVQPVVPSAPETEYAAKEAIPSPSIPERPPVQPPPPQRTQPVAVPQAQPMQKKRSESSNQEISGMKKTLRILGIISVFIIGYIIVKYVLISHKPHFSSSDQAAASVQDEVGFKVVNSAVEMVLVPGDSTFIGSLDDDARHDEFPPHRVALNSFYISSEEITREQWAMANPDYVCLDEEKNLPITNVSWDEALEYCNDKSIKDGLKPCYDFTNEGVECDFNANGYRLPTEAEWEYAAKAGKHEEFYVYSGSNTPDVVGWYKGNSENRMHPVASKAANALGTYDMSGNAAEWVWDWYAGYSSDPDLALKGPQKGSDKIFRGGSWYHDDYELRVTSRLHAKPFLKTEYIGFRVARSR